MGETRSPHAASTTDLSCPESGPPVLSPQPRSLGPEIPGYEIVGELGRGGMGVVYKARQVRLDRLVALKMVLSGRSSSADELVRFRREVETVASLQHPNLVAIYEVGEHEGLPYFAMEYVSGGCLEDRLADLPQPPRLAAEMVETLARAMNAVHKRGVVHRDLKPGNVLLDNSQDRPGSYGTPKITDFGLARKTDSARGPTATGAILGTPSYMAPEQAVGKTKDVTAAADIYALGAILYQMLTGRPPFEAESPIETIRQVASEEPIAPRKLQPRIPRDLETICLKCLEKDPLRRYATAQEMADDLHRFRVNEPIHARPVGRLTRLVKWSRRHPAAAALLGVSAAALAIIIGGGLVYGWMLQNALADARQGLVRLHVHRGARLLDDGDWFRALAWFSEALALDATDPNSQFAHRTRIAVTLRQCPRLLRLMSHDGPVLHSGFSPDGLWIVTASEDGTARLWNRESTNGSATTLHHDGPVVGARFRFDGKSVLTASSDKTARIWNVADGRALSPPLSHASAVTTASFHPSNPDIVLTGADDGTVALWDLRAPSKPIHSVKHEKSVTAALFFPDGKSVITASADGTARVWQADDLQPRTPPLQLPARVTAAALTPDSQRFVTGCADGTVTAWNLSGERVWSDKHRGGIVQVGVSPDGQIVASASDDHTTCLYRAPNGRTYAETLRHKSGVNCLAFSPDSRFVVTGSDDNSAIVWCTEFGDTLGPLLRHNGSINAVQFSPDGKCALTAGSDCVVRLWDLRSATLARVDPKSRFRTPAELPPASTWTSPDGKFVAKVRDGHSVVVLDSSTGKLVGPVLPHGSDVLHGAFSPDGTRLVTACDDDTGRIWNWRAGQLAASPLMHNGAVLFAAFGPEGRRVVTTCADGTTRVWDTRAGDPLTPPLRVGAAVRDVNLDESGTVLVLTDANSAKQTWDLRPTKASVDDLLRLTRCLAGGRIDPHLGFIPLQPAEMLEAARSHGGTYPDDIDR